MQLNTNRRFWTNILDNALYHHPQNAKYGNIFKKNGVPLGQSRGLKNLYWGHIETVLVADGGTKHLTKALYAVFSFNFSPHFT